jgi:hypothetical protein
LITKGIHDFTDETIVAVCFTNHALDDFLLHLLEHGISEQSIVRIGGSDKIDPRLEKIKLFNIADKVAQSAASQKEFAILAASVEEIQQAIAELESEHTNVLYYLRDHQPTWFNRFKVDPSRSKGPDGMELVTKKGEKITIWSLLNAWQRNKKDTGFVEQLLNANGHRDRSIWSWTAKQREEKSDEWFRAIHEDRIGDFAKLVAQLRIEQQKLAALKLMRKKIALEGRRIIGCTTSGAAKHAELLEHVRSGVLVVEEAGEILESHILTAFSSHPKHLIMIGDHEQLRPKGKQHTCICLRCCTAHDAHCFFRSLSVVDTYELTCEHRNGYDLNRSMFERLVKSGFPMVALSKQHRMHDDIAQLVRTMTYPQLVTAAYITDATRPHPMGLQHRITFFNHNHLEDSYAGMKQRDGDATDSKVNSKEAELVVRTAIYLLKQGYKQNQLVILTPYLGQLQVLKEELRKRALQAVISELDQQDLLKAEQKAKLLNPAAAAAAAAQQKLQGSSSSSSSSSPLIKISTVDNFQGEGSFKQQRTRQDVSDAKLILVVCSTSSEADIVLASLVRCNDDNVIGFIGEKERVNVLLSRPRDGIVLFGSKKTLCSQKDAKKQQWLKVFAVPKANGSASSPGIISGLFNMAISPQSTPAVFVSDGLPIVCPRHASEKTLLVTLDDFKKSPVEGGCSRVCGSQIGCGKHACKRTCHLVLSTDHQANACREIVQFNCGRHVTQVRCSAPPKQCSECEREERELQKAQEELHQLQMQVQLEEMTQAASLAHQKLKLEMEYQKELLSLKKQQESAALEVQKQALAKKQAEAILAQKQEHEAYLAQLQKDLAAKQAAMPKNAPVYPFSPEAAAAAASPSNASSSSSKLFTALEAGSPDFLRVQAAFFESLAGMPDYLTMKFVITGVHKINNPKLLKQYETAKAARKQQKGNIAEKTVYHGTRTSNIPVIAQNNLSMSKKGQLDPGWFGAGLYFSPHADYCMMYHTTGKFGPVKIGDRGRLMVFQVMPGRINQLQTLDLGQPKHAQFDSNLSKNGFELVLFDEQFVLPSHIIDFEAKHAPGQKFTGEARMTVAMLAVSYVGAHASSQLCSHL